ncbi:MAG: tRNA (adenosine(37)-N6)-threonylcarbamoyltransferase complex ATPase subunit type 1 TsaE [Paracoccaceae bacterium]
MTVGFSKTLKTGSPESTARLATRIAPVLRGGDVLLLEGEIGAGKTHFARALIQTRLNAVGLSEDVPSPTFTLVQTYDDGISEIWHADLYRLLAPQEIIELGLEDAFAAEICLVEWPENLGPFRPETALTIRFDVGADEQSRILQFTGDATLWEKILALL